MGIQIAEQYDKIYRYCYFKLHDQQKAEDIVQETFLRFLECEHYAEIGRKLPYLYTIARNLCMDEFRKKKMEELPQELAGIPPETKWIEHFELVQALKELEPEERELIFLRVVNEVPMADLVRIYEKSRFALHRKISKVLKKLERRMTDETGYERTAKADL